MTAIDVSCDWARCDYSAITAKFLPPPLPRLWVHRDRLDRQLSIALQHRLTVVTGPPGAGKTGLLVDWAQRRPNGLVAWLNVEAADNDPKLFRDSVAAALGTDHAQHGARFANRSAREGDQGLELLEGHTLWDRPRVLVVDDFHLISDERVISSLAHLVDHLPSNLRLVFVGQRTPAFARRRLVRDEATSIVNDDLRFTSEECAALIASATGRFISYEDLEILTERNEGWAAGLHLAALELGAQEDPSGFVRRYSGAFDPVSEYLEHEMLLCQPADLVSFLLQTSVLDRLTGESCLAITGRHDAGKILRSFADQNLFVIPVGPAEGVYRYHHLLADVLRSRLQREGLSVGRDAHFDAATWFEQIGDLRSAVDHFAQAEEYGRAVSLLFSNLPRAWNTFFLDNEVVAPKADDGRDPSHTYLLAATRLGRLKVSQAAKLLQQLNVSFAECSDRQMWRGRTEFLWALYAHRVADASAVLERTQATLEFLGPNMGLIAGCGGSPATGLNWVQTIDMAVSTYTPLLAAHAHLWLGELDEAQEVLVDHFGSPETAEANEPALLALLACRRGQLSLAYRLGRAALQRTEEPGGEGFATFDARLAVAEVLFEHNELEQAQELLQSAVQLCASAQASHWASAAEVDLVQLMIALERPSEALDRLGRLRLVALRDPLPRHLVKRINEVEIGCRVSLGDLEGALSVARSVDRGDISSQTLARIDLASGRPDRALARLTTDRPVSLAHEVRRLVLLACTERQLGGAVRADDAMCRAVNVARPEGYVRPFLEPGGQVLPLLRGIYASGGDPYPAHLLRQAERAAPSAHASGQSTMLEPLTERERQVLGFLSSHLSCRQIAARVYISPNTAKSHVKSLYRKLGASSRDEAVAIAVSCGLL